MLGKGIEQLYVFAVFWALGVGLSLIYIFAVGLTKSKLAATVFDGIFGAVAIYLTWKVNLEINNGEFRLFIFVGLILGCVVTYFTCKSTLDKLSALLYNLLTIKIVEQSDGKDLSQKVDGNRVRGGNAGTGVAGLHATGNADTVVLTKSTRRRTKSNDTKSQGRRRRTAKIARLHQRK